MNRTHYYVDPDILDGIKGREKGDDGEYVHDDDGRHRVETEEEATLVSSWTGETDEQGDFLHMPVIDIDLPCKLLPSKTPGHFHLYIDKPMPFNDMQKLLSVMADVGIVEQGYVGAMNRRGATFVRLPCGPQTLDELAVVVWKEYGPSKVIQAIKELRVRSETVLNHWCGLKEAKDAIDRVRTRRPVPEDGEDGTGAEGKASAGNQTEPVGSGGASVVGCGCSSPEEAALRHPIA